MLGNGDQNGMAGVRAIAARMVAMQALVEI